MLQARPSTAEDCEGDAGTKDQGKASDVEGGDEGEEEGFRLHKTIQRTTADRDTFAPTPKRDAVKELQRKLAKQNGPFSSSASGSAPSGVPFSALVASASKSAHANGSPFLVPVVSAASAAYLPPSVVDTSNPSATTMEVDSAHPTTSSSVTNGSSNAAAGSAASTPVSTGTPIPTPSASSGPAGTTGGAVPSGPTLPVVFPGATVTPALPFSGAPTFAAALASTPSAATILSAETRLQAKRREQNEAIANALARRAALGAAQGPSQPAAASQSAPAGGAAPIQPAAVGAAPTPPNAFGAAPVQTALFGATPAQTALFGAAPAQPTLFGAAPALFGAAPVQPAGAAPVQVAALGAAPAQVAAVGVAPIPVAAAGAALAPAAAAGAAPAQAVVAGAAPAQAAAAGVAFPPNLVGAVQLRPGLVATAMWMPEPVGGDPPIYGWDEDHVHEHMHDRQIAKWNNAPVDKAFVYEWDGRRHHDDIPTIESLSAGVTRAVGCQSPLIGPAEPSPSANSSSPFLYLLRNLTPAQIQHLLSRRCWSGCGTTFFPIEYAPPSSPFLGSIYGLTFSATLEHAGEVARLIALTIQGSYAAQSYLSLVNDNFPAGVDPIAHLISSLRVVAAQRTLPNRTLPQLIWNVTAQPPSALASSNRAWVTIFEGLEFDSDMYYVGKVVKPALFCGGCKSLGHQRDFCAHRQLVGFQDQSSASRAAPPPASSQSSQGNGFRRNDNGGRGGNSGGNNGNNGNNGGGRRNQRGNKRQRT
ncbi:hypothetical protein DFH06DRAFT_1139374 [Mycena polygramma]|nr:hypothetical protein DFH06DRAFT_1139374 [Mycena polygramma]